MNLISTLSQGLYLRQLKILLEDVESPQNACVQVAFPSLNVVIRIISEPSQVSGHRSMVLYQTAKYS